MVVLLAGLIFSSLCTKHPLDH